MQSKGFASKQHAAHLFQVLMIIELIPLNESASKNVTIILLTVVATERKGKRESVSIC